ncbi:cytochrome b [Rhodovulum sp. DZ06]|uniref:cytochrome b n=1 Tax=Rhodovulum sp. DZ06 TaxID=3425126 RepID=UPI003D335E44
MSGVYHPVQRALHWAVAAAIVVIAPLGIGIENLSDAEVRELTGGGLGLGDLYWWHKSFGFLALFLMIARIAAKVAFGTPPHDPPLARHERILSTAVHHLIYVLLVALPVLGWLGTSLFGPGVANFFVLTMPDLVGQDREASGLVLSVHGALAMALLALVALHIAGAAWHGWVKRDGVVERMTGSGREAGEQE